MPRTWNNGMVEFKRKQLIIATIKFIVLPVKRNSAILIMAIVVGMAYLFVGIYDHNVSLLV